MKLSAAEFDRSLRSARWRLFQFCKHQICTDDKLFGAAINQLANSFLQTRFTDYRSFGERIANHELQTCAGNKCGWQNLRTGIEEIKSVLNSLLVKGQKNLSVNIGVMRSLLNNNSELKDLCSMLHHCLINFSEGLSIALYNHEEQNAIREIPFIAEAATDA